MATNRTRSSYRGEKREAQREEESDGAYHANETKRVDSTKRDSSVARDGERSHRRSRDGSRDVSSSSEECRRRSRPRRRSIDDKGRSLQRGNDNAREKKKDKPNDTDRESSPETSGRKRHNSRAKVPADETTIPHRTKRSSKTKATVRNDSLAENSRMVSIASAAIYKKELDGTSTSESDPRPTPRQTPKANSKADRPADILKCPLCLKTFDCPILLPCAHSFCKDCISILVEASDGLSFRCPLCNVKVQLTGAQEELFCPNFIILKQAEQEESYDDLACSSCDQRNTTYMCEECADGLCSDCFEAHQVIKYTKDHRAKRIESKSDFESMLRKRYFCSEHSNELLRHYCKTCDKSLCRECAFRDHKGDNHSCVPIGEAAKQGREGLRRTLFNLQSRIPKLHLALMDVKRVKRVLRKQVRAVSNEIAESMKRLVGHLQEREKHLIKKVDDIYAAKCKSFDDQRNQLLVDLERYEVSKQLLLQMSEHDSDVELLQMKGTVEQALRDLEASNIRKIEFDNNTLLLKSNEAAIKREIDKHGGIQTLSVESATTTLMAKSNGSVESGGCSTAILQSDLGQNQGLAPAVTTHALLTSTPTRKRIISMKARANWLLVKSRLNEIVRFGEASKRIDLKLHRKQKPLELSMLQRAIAKSTKTKANWYLVRLRLKEIVAYKRGWLEGRKMQPKDSVDVKEISAAPELAKAVISSLSKDLKARQLVVKDPIQRDLRSLRSQAISRRAKANWLIIRSRVNAIRQYGRLHGTLPPTSSSLYKPQSHSVAVSRMRNLRGKVLRARANWLLVASRVPQIIQHGRSSEQPKTRGWNFLHEKIVSSNGLANQKKKSSASRQRAKVNWLRVKSRLNDIVWYGEMRRISRNQSSMNSSLEPLNQPRSVNILSKQTAAPAMSRSQLRLRARSMRAKSNWLLVRSRLPDIVALASRASSVQASSKPPRGRPPSADQRQSAPPKPQRALSAEGIHKYAAQTPRVDERSGSSNLATADSRSMQALSNWGKLIERSRSDYFSSLFSQSRPLSSSKSREEATYSKRDEHNRGTPKSKQETQVKGGYPNSNSTPKQEKKGKSDPGSTSRDSSSRRTSEISEDVYATVEKHGHRQDKKRSWEPMDQPSTSQESDHIYVNWDSTTESLQDRLTRTHFNWMLVRLRLRDIIEYGRRRDNVAAAKKRSFADMVRLQIEKEQRDLNNQKKAVAKTLFDSFLPSKGIKGEDTRILNFKVKDYKDRLQDIEMQLASPDQSILSAHMAENVDGTFTIYCCPRIDSDFNIFVSLSNGKFFKRGARVLNFFGSFQGLSKKEVDLACRTIGLVRWHFTPGLLVRKGNKILPRKQSKT